MTRGGLEAGQPAAGGQDKARPTVALVLDTDDWAFANIVRQLERHLGERFRFLPIPVAWFPSLSRALQLAEGADLIHFFWREHISQLDWPDEMRELERLFGSASKGLLRLFAGARLTTCIFDHLFLSPSELEDRGERFRRFGIRYGVASSRLMSLYRGVVAMPPPSALLRDGVDRSHFSPRNLERLADAGQTRDLIVGWAGNSSFTGLGEDPKGLGSVIQPAIDELRRRGRKIRLEVVDRAAGRKAHSEMPFFYSTIDVYCCASIAEGTPNPVLEAMACGVPVLSTDVGIVSEAFGSRQRELGLFDRTAAALVSRLEFLLDMPAQLNLLSEENLESIVGWDWSVRARSYEDFFNQQLGSR